MGTRAITHVVDQEGNVYVSLYRQFDGYLSGGHGEDLAKFLQGAVVGNGIRGGESRNFFNGVGDLACRLITFFKQDASDMGGFYIERPDASQTEEFTYTVKANSPKGWEDPETDVEITVQYYGRSFTGSPEEFSEYVTWCSKEEDEEEEDY